jgi:hypothetical protein
MGSYALVGGPSSLDRSLPPSHLRAAQSQETMRENRLKSWIMDDRSHYSSPSQHNSSPSFDTQRSVSVIGYGSAPMIDSPTSSEFSKRPGSQASEIRAQMNELKDRISGIKERAKETNGKRASLISLASIRTPSPTRSGSQGHHSSPFGSGSGKKEQSLPPRSQSSGDRNSVEQSLQSSPKPRPKSAGSQQSNGTTGIKPPPQFSLKEISKPEVSTNTQQRPLDKNSPESQKNVRVRRQESFGELTDYEESHYEDAEETLDDLEDSLNRPTANRAIIHPSSAIQVTAVIHQPIAAEVIEELSEPGSPYSEDIPPMPKHRYAHSRNFSKVKNQTVAISEEDEDDFERDMESSVSGATEYFDSSADVGVVSHEDRVDAFDYENFFLHSAMGTYSREVRRGEAPYSSDSDNSDADSVGSVETARAASVYRAPGAHGVGIPGAYETETEEMDDDGFYDDEDREAIRNRKSLRDSFSGGMNTSTASVATFRTAQDDFDDDEDGFEDEVLDATVLPSRASFLQNTSSKGSNVYQVNGNAAANPARRSIMTPPSQPPSSNLPADPPSTSSSSSSGGTTNNRPASKSGEFVKHSAMLANFIGYDSVTASQDTIQSDRMLVEQVVVLLQRKCLELQRAPESAGGKREKTRGLLRDVQKMLEDL